MPKDRRSSSSFDRYTNRVSPYPHPYNTRKQNPKTKPSSPPVGNENQWEDATCPICMEHPHNAVLLLCSSRNKGCLPFICDTSRRHSNCLDQFRKSKSTANHQTNLVCPLCRGKITGWTVVGPARDFMNSKTRSCSLATCDFSGNYSEIRRHARRVHPLVCPTNVDPEKEIEFRNLEDEIEQQDMFRMQFEFGDDDVIDDGDIEDELMNGIYELASPIWDYDLDFQNFFNTFGAGFADVFPELDWDDSDDDWDEFLGVSSSSSSSSSRSRMSTNNRQRTTNRNRVSHNREEQITTLVDFHELRSNRS